MREFLAAIVKATKDLVTDFVVLTSVMVLVLVGGLLTVVAAAVLLPLLPAWAPALLMVMWSSKPRREEARRLCEKVEEGNAKLDKMRKAYAKIIEKGRYDPNESKTPLP